MPIRFSDKPYLNYSGDARRMGDNSGINPEAFYRGLSPTAKPMACAPDHPVKVYTRDGKSTWAHYRRDSWRELKAYKDFKTGSADWRETGFSVDAVAWSSR